MLPANVINSSSNIWRVGRLRFNRSDGGGFVVRCSLSAPRNASTSGESREPLGILYGCRSSAVGRTGDLEREIHGGLVRDGQREAEPADHRRRNGRRKAYPGAFSRRR